MTQKEKIDKFNHTLFRWHKTHYRPMAWRNTHDPYRILVSEVMLQQTQVERVRTKYAEFVKIFPTVQVLARASLGEVLRAWQGLGYNRRAKFLHECAKKIMGEHKGKFPRSEKELRALPGIGISTTAAIRSFAFGEDEPMIDTNIRRILVRVFFPKKIPSDAELFLFAAALIPKGKGREWNYAMLDLGATLCTARDHSPKCPLNALHGKVGDFVYKKPQKKFAGSARYYRGRILALLSKEDGMDSGNFIKQLGLDKRVTGDLLERLAQEGLIVKKRSKYALP